MREAEEEQAEKKGEEERRRKMRRDGGGTVEEEEGEQKNPRRPVERIWHKQKYVHIIRKEDATVRDQIREKQHGSRLVGTDLPTDRLTDQRSDVLTGGRREKPSDGPTKG